MAGFNDQEEKIGEELKLRQYSENAYRQADQLAINSRQSYFSLITFHVFEEKFKDDAERIIMTMLGDGARIGAISAVLKSKEMKCHRQTIRYVIRKYETKWGMKQYKSSQLSSKIA